LLNIKLKTTCVVYPIPEDDDRIFAISRYEHRRVAEKINSVISFISNTLTLKSVCDTVFDYFQGVLSKKYCAFLNQ